MIAFMYAALRFSHLATKHNPNISTYFIEDGMDGAKVLNLNDRGFRIAVSVESFIKPNVRKDDSMYVR